MRKISLVIFYLVICKAVVAQRLQVTAFLGDANYQGDLQEKRYTFDQSHLAYGAGFLYEVTGHIFVRLNVTQGEVSGDDKKASRIDNRERNLNFFTSLTDIHLGLEYDLLSLDEHKITPYLFAGVSGYHFDPYTFDTAGKKIYLQPLGTEGQGFYNNRKKYNLNQLAVPFGGGVKFAMGDNFRVGVELGLRKLFSDYLDDVSRSFSNKAGLLAYSGQKAVDISFRADELNPGLNYPDDGIRGNPKSKDWYYFTGITLGYRISPGEGGHPNRGRGKYGCPVNIY